MNNIHQSSIKLLVHLHQKRSQEEGYSLVIALSSILLLGTLLVTAALISKVDSSSTNASINSNSGFYAAEAGLNIQARDIRDAFEGFKRPSGTEPNSWESCIDNDSNNDGSGDFACDTSLTINNQQLVSFVDDITEDSEISVTINSGAFRGLSAQEYRYDLFSVALNQEGAVTSPTSILGMRFKSRLVPVFQFAAFYEQDLAFTIPPTMTMNGRVHSNGDLYLNAGGDGDTLAIEGIVTTPGTLYRGEKTLSTDCRTDVTIFDGSSQRVLACGTGSTRQAYPQSTLSDWNDFIFVESDNYKLTLPEMTNFEMPPSSVLTNPTDRAEYVSWEKADLRLALQLDNSNNPTGINILNIDGSVNTSATAGLNSCAPISTTLQAETSGDDNYEATDITLNVSSANSFNVGDRLQIGSDYDSNVITAKDDTNDTITIRRQLGHAYQTQPVTKNNVVKKAVVSTSDTFFNYREKNGSTGENAGRFIRMLEVDAKELINCIDSNVSGSNGLMGSKDIDEDSEGGLVWFLTVQGPDSGTDITASTPGQPNNYGVRLYNASDLSSDVSTKTIKGLTIVSDQAVYTQGNYNVSNKIPAAILSDSFNVLSTAWNNDDSNSRTYNTNNLQDTTVDTQTRVTSDVSWGDNIRDADDTTLNVALFNGQDPMGGGNGDAFQDLGDDTNSGGVNNFPRFHEDWYGSYNCGTPGHCTLTYLGSMVSFGQAQRVNGDFCNSFYTGCNIYTPPIRNWSFDTSFEQAQNLPPLTPRAVFISQEVFERDFSYTSFHPTQKPSFSVAAISRLQISAKSSNPDIFKTSFTL